MRILNNFSSCLDIFSVFFIKFKSGINSLLGSNIKNIISSKTRQFVGKLLQELGIEKNFRGSKIILLVVGLKSPFLDPRSVGRLGNGHDLQTPACGDRK